MNVTLQPITRNNWISLAPTEEQANIGFVAPTRVSLAQARYQPWWHPRQLPANGAQ